MRAVRLGIEKRKTEDVPALETHYSNIPEYLFAVGLNCHNMTQ